MSGLAFGPEVSRMAGPTAVAKSEEQYQDLI